MMESGEWVRGCFGEVVNMEIYIFSVFVKSSVCSSLIATLCESRHVVVCMVCFHSVGCVSPNCAGPRVK